MSATNAPIERLKDIARKSTNTIKHAAVVMIGGKILSYGFNSMRGSKTDHAECSAIRKYMYTRGINETTIFKRKFSKLTVVVIRLSCGDNISMSKPCKHCIEYMRKLGIKAVIYSNNNGDMIKENVKKINNKHVCQLRRVFKNKKY